MEGKGPGKRKVPLGSSLPFNVEQDSFPQGRHQRSVSINLTSYIYLAMILDTLQRIAHNVPKLLTQWPLKLGTQAAIKSGTQEEL